MDVLRRNTDYALRMMVSLAGNLDGKAMSARQLAADSSFSYQLACKLLQRLHKAKLVTSTMGPKGGFVLSKDPASITLMDIIEPIQGGIRMNRCLTGSDACEFEANCQVHTKLACLQLYIEGYLSGITLQEIVSAESKQAVEI